MRRHHIVRMLCKRHVSICKLSRLLKQGNTEEKAEGVQCWSDVPEQQGADCGHLLPSPHFGMSATTKATHAARAAARR